MNKQENTTTTHDRSKHSQKPTWTFVNILWTFGNMCEHPQKCMWTFAPRFLWTFVNTSSPRYYWALVAGSCASHRFMEPHLNRFELPPPSDSSSFVGRASYQIAEHPPAPRNYNCDCAAQKFIKQTIIMHSWTQTKLCACSGYSAPHVCNNACIYDYTYIYIYI